LKKNSHAEIALVFRTLSDPTRLRLLNLLSRGEVCVCHLSDTLEVVQPKVSRHLAYLKRAGFVETRRDGKWMHYRWTEHSHPLARVVLEGLRTWMARDGAMNRDRQKLKKVCC
jgi:ArsR family transcriptional regulator